MDFIRSEKVSSESTCMSNVCTTGTFTSKKCSNFLELHLSKVNFYKIHTLRYPLKPPLILPSWPVQSGIISFILFDVCYPITSNRICEATNKVQKKNKLLGIHKPTSMYVPVLDRRPKIQDLRLRLRWPNFFFWKFKASKRHSAINWPLCRLIDNEINVE